MFRFPHCLFTVSHLNRSKSSLVREQKRKPAPPGWKRRCFAGWIDRIETPVESRQILSKNEKRRKRWRKKWGRKRKPCNTIVYIRRLYFCSIFGSRFVNKAANTAGHCSHCTWKNKLRFIVGEIVEGFEICDARSVVRLSNVCRVSLSPHPFLPLLYRFSSTNSPVCGKYRWDQPRRPRVSTCRVRVREELTPEFCTLSICFDSHGAWWFAKWFKIWEKEEIFF